MLDERTEAKRAKQARSRERLRAAERTDVVRAVMQHRTGRDFVYWLLELGHLARNPFTANALTTAFQCGQFDVAQAIQRLVLDVAPDGYITMIREQEDDRRILDTTDDNERGEPGGSSDDSQAEWGTFGPGDS